MAFLRDEKEMRIQELMKRQADALGTLKAAQYQGEKSVGYVWNSIAGNVGRKHTQGLYLEKPKADKSTGKSKLFQPKKTYPILHVYLDSNALIQDFSTDAALYQAKMAQAGFPVQKIVFQLSKKVASFNSHSQETKYNRQHLTRDIQNELPTHQQQTALANQNLTPPPHNHAQQEREAAWILRKKPGAHLSEEGKEPATPLEELPQLDSLEAHYIQKSVEDLPFDIQKTAVSAMSARLRREKEEMHRKNKGQKPL